MNVAIQRSICKPHAHSRSCMYAPTLVLSEEADGTFNLINMFQLIDENNRTQQKQKQQQAKLYLEVEKPKTDWKKIKLNKNDDFKFTYREANKKRCKWRNFGKLL